VKNGYDPDYSFRKSLKVVDRRQIWSLAVTKRELQPPLSLDCPLSSSPQAALRRFLEKELKYPEEARKRGEEGLVIVLFTVNEKGLVEDPGVVNGDKKYFNEEALRIVTNFPEWTPGEIDGIPSSIQVSVPIEFRLR